jgi:hypothetical protein
MRQCAGRGNRIGRGSGLSWAAESGSVRGSGSSSHRAFDGRGSPRLDPAWAQLSPSGVTGQDREP